MKNRKSVYGGNQMPNTEYSSTTSGILLRAIRGGTPEWKDFVPDFNGAPKVNSVFTILGTSKHLELFAITEDGTLLHDWRDGDSWHGWQPDFLGAPKVTAVFGVPGATGHTEMFIIGQDGTLYHDWLDNQGWHGWQPDFLGAPKVTAVFGVPGASGATEMFLIGRDGTLYHNWLADDDGNWHAWEPNFQNAPRVKAVTGANFDESTDVFAIKTDGTLLYNFYITTSNDRREGHWHGYWESNFAGNSPKVAYSAFVTNTWGGELFVVSEP
jgi:hypothetical protein